LTIPLATDVSAEAGGVAGVSPAEGVADKQAKGGEDALAQSSPTGAQSWERGGDFPLQIEIPKTEFAVREICGSVDTATIAR
jgi:hypothetical protein